MPHETILCVPLGGEIQFRLYPDATHDFDDWPNRPVNSRKSGFSASIVFTNQCKSFLEPLRYFTFALYHGPSNFNEKAKQSMSIRLRIISEMQRIAAEQQVTLPPLGDDLSLHETGFDSLGFAILVARLEDDLGIDPFTISEDASFPLTMGDFIRAYENVPA
jgi:acyl carrier protein